MGKKTANKSLRSAKIIREALDNAGVRSASTRNTNFDEFAARVGANVTWVRKLRYGASVEGAIADSGISRATWYAVERGKAPARAGAHLDKIASFFGLDIALFVLPPEEFMAKVKK